MSTERFTIDIRPTPTGYANALLMLLESGDHKGKAWAKAEVVRLIKAAATITPDAWGKEDQAAAERAADLKGA